jgi:hypothetical protein
MTQTPPPASPQSALLLQISAAAVPLQRVPNGEFVTTAQTSPVGQSSGSSQAMLQSPGHCEASLVRRQLGPPVLERQQTVLVRSHWVDPHVT